MLLIELWRLEIENGGRASESIRGDQKKHQHVTRMRGVQKKSDFRRRHGPSFWFASPFRFRRQRSKNVRHVADFLPFSCAI
ncbi:MAG TPA: hypothetical protein VNF99_20120 [Stellaceae bacterium]|nr:hypothetical protein [Stellaceae bacterium]